MLKKFELSHIALLYFLFVLVVILVVFLAEVLPAKLQRTGFLIQTENHGNSAVASGAIGPLQIDLNTASEEVLAQVPGLGKNTAKKIISYREEHGPFYSVEDLCSVKGITAEQVAQWQTYLFVR